jgi:hypothetical protein
MRPPPGYERKLAKTASREDRFTTPRESWDERDWRVQREQDAEKRRQRADLLASLDRQERPVIPPALTVASFSLHDRTADRERQRRIDANLALEKAGLRYRLHW